MALLKNFFPKARYLALYGLLMAVLVFALKWLQWKFLIGDHSLEIYVGLIAVFFTLLGVWVATQLVRPKLQTVVVEKEVFRESADGLRIDEAALDRLNLSNRECEVLQQLTSGNSNAEIADNLSLSLSTVKTHVSNLFVKMEVKSRAQAIEKANRLRISNRAN